MQLPLIYDHHKGAFVIHEKIQKKAFKWAEHTHQNTVISCFLGEPRNSGLSLCSRIHTTLPTKRKKAPVTHHI